MRQLVASEGLPTARAMPDSLTLTTMALVSAKVNSTKDLGVTRAFNRRSPTGGKPLKYSCGLFTSPPRPDSAVPPAFFLLRQNSISDYRRPLCNPSGSTLQLGTFLATLHIQDDCQTILTLRQP